MKKRSFIKSITTFLGGLLTAGLSSIQARGNGQELPEIPEDEANDALERPLHSFLNKYDIVPRRGRPASYIRPPGALLHERRFQSQCISCGACVNVCHIEKYNAVVLDGAGDVRNFGTPYVKDMRDFPCTLCMKCPDVCPTDALSPIEIDDVEMGMALIDYSICLGWNGDVCLSCSKACPIGERVFDFYHGEWGNQPDINQDCVGCGLCVKFCPVGGSAIAVVTPKQYEQLKNEFLHERDSILQMDHMERYDLIYGENLPKLMQRGTIEERWYN